MIILLYLLILGIFVFFRYIAPDEGLYLSASSEIRYGKLPYLDFFYPQAPLFPYFYSGFASFQGLYMGRALSAFFSLVLGFLIYIFVLKYFKSRKTALSIFILYSFNGLLLTWQSTFMPYAISNLFSFLSFIFLSKKFFDQDFFSKPVNFLLSGLFIGSAINIRLIFAPIFILILTILLFYPKSRISVKLKASFLILLGAAVPSVLTFYLFLTNSQVFWFNNLGYHLMWGEKVVQQSLETKIFTLAKFIFYPQNLILIILSLISLFFSFKNLLATKVMTPESKIILLSSGYAVIITNSYLLANPTILPYYQQVIPYLLILSIPAVNRILIQIEKFSYKKILAWSSVTAYALLILPYFLIFILALRPSSQCLISKNVKLVIEAIQKNTDKEDRILSSLALYPVLADRKPVSGFETCGYEITPYLTEEQIQKFKLLSKNNLRELIFNQKVKLIVLPDDRLDDLLPSIEEKYTKKEIGGVKIYIKNE